MLQIDDILVSLDIAERYFCCDLDACLGACCIEGDAGAPVTPEEADTLRALYPTLKPDLAPRACREIETAGVAYVDEEGDLVTSIVDGRNCVFTCFASGGLCQCAVERAHSRGASPMRKPLSCALYPIRATRYDGFTALNYHRWSICRGAERLGRRLGIRVYQFLEGPLTEAYGAEWYAQLREACDEWLRQHPEV